VQFTKVIFLFNRYFVEGVLCSTVYVLLEFHSPLSQEICHNFILFVACTSIVAITIANVVVIFHIQSLWERRKAVTYALLVGFFITYGVTVACAGLVANDFQSHVLWVPEVKTCIVPHKPMPLIGVWAGMVTFDIFMLVMMFANAVDRPYRQTSELVHNLRRDGMKFFTALLFLRSVNLVLTIFCTPAEVLVIVFFLWAIVSVTLSRFVLMIKAMEAEVALREGGDRDGHESTTTTTLWRSQSGYWSRKSDLIELKTAP